jgi:signal transduction histidine kinase
MCSDDASPLPALLSATPIDDLLATLAHELRGPMTVLQLNVEAMLAELLGPDPERSSCWFIEHIERQQRGIRRLRRLLDSLLDSCQLSEKGFEPHREWVDLRELVLEGLKTECDALKLAGCSCSMAAGAPAPGFWDGGQLRLAIGNLIGNAIKYGAGRPIEVAVQCDGRQASLRVRDHGAGVAPEDRELIFERFKRARSSSAVAGVGLGLWLVRCIARAHDGDVHLVNGLEPGACFVLKLPTHDSPDGYGW